MISGGPERRRRRACLAPIALLAAALGPLPLPRAALADEALAPAVGDEHQRSPEGRRFRVRFDPASRAWIGARAALAVDAARLAGAAEPSAGGAPPARPALEIDAGLSYRSWIESGAGAARVVWQVDHRVLAGWVAPLARPFAGAPALDAAVYGASLLRHDESPRVVLPMSPPVSVPFPFDVGVEGEVGRVHIPAVSPASAGGPVPVLQLGVLRASALLDPWRSGSPGRSVEIGVGVRYDLDAYAEALPGAPDVGEGSAAPTPSPTGAGQPRPLGQPRVVHRIAPMTAGSLRVRVQGEDGLTVLDCRGDVVPHWSSEGRWQVMVQSDAHLERTLVAINDQPVAAVLEGGYRLLPPALDAAALHDLRVSLGLTFALQLR